MVIHRPDFIVIGAMKSATTTLHEQLRRQPGFFMTSPKEPNFFSDDAIHARGWAWYGALFRSARPGDLRGESSTHYTKLPTHPRTVERMARALPWLKLVYLMRHPIDRLISQYVHEVTGGRIGTGLAEAVVEHPELIDYSRYSMAYCSPAADASGTRSGWNTVAFGAAKSDRFELTNTRDLGYPAAASRVLSRRAWPRM